MKKIRLKIEGMTCSACSNGLEKYLNKQVGIIDAVVNLILQEVFIQYEDNITINELEKFIKEAGFKSLGVACENDILKSSKKNRDSLILMAIITIIIFLINMFFISFNINNYYLLILLLLTLIILYFSRDIIINGIKNIIYKIPNMDSLVSLSIMCSFIYSIYSMVMIMLGNNKYLDCIYFDSVVMVLFFIKLGRYIEGTSKTKTISAIKELVQITPQKAILKVNNIEKEVTIDEIKRDDILIAKPGMKIAVDGVVVKGNSHLDETFITGESKPIKKREGDNVIAGSMNYDGLLEYQAKKIGKNSTISEIIHLVVDATNTKAPITKVADKLCGYFVPTLLVIATLTFIIYLLLGNTLNYSLNIFVTILVVACPCALGLATPLALVVSTGICAKKGILVKSSEVLEKASKIDTIVFDKTGTLTTGNLSISKIYKDNTYSYDKLLKIIASIEKYSTHPISYVFTKYAKDNKLKLETVNYFKNLTGIGITGKINNDIYYLGNNKLFISLNIDNPYYSQEIELSKLGNSIIYVIRNNKVIALIGIKDLIKEEAIEVISSLKKLNKEIIMLTGDNKEVAKLVANELNIDKFIADVTPQEKSNLIYKLKEQGKKVMMIGDGINDAPSLALADIGVSLEGASDIATNTADVILLKNDLTRIVSLVIISKKTLNNIYENLFWAFIYNMLMIPIAMGLFRCYGLIINPVIASIAMVLSSLTVVFNALRLKKIIK